MQHLSHRRSDEIAVLNSKIEHLQWLLRLSFNHVAMNGDVELCASLHEALGAKSPWKKRVPKGEPNEVDGSAWDKLPPAPTAKT